MGQPMPSRRSMNKLMKAAGTARVSARVAKGILDRIRAMTPDERADQFNLQALGLTPEQAKALAMTGAGKPAKRTPRYGSPIGKMGPTLSEVHMPNPGGRSLTVDRKDRRKAKRAAKVAKGGPGSGPRPGGGAGIASATSLAAATHIDAAARHMERAKQARDAGDHANAMKHAELAHQRLTTALKASTQRLQKSAVGLTQDEPSEPVAKSSTVAITKRHMVANLANQYVRAAYGADQTMAPDGGFEDRPDVARYLDAQRLVAGIDQETINGATTPAQARARASGALATNMGAYDRVVAGPDRNIAGVGGLNLDLGSGNARERGYLGLDVYPYDYGTVIHDLGMGIPFPDGSARAVRLCNSLADMDDYKDDPTPLMSEIQRVLGIGGRLYYEGDPIQDKVDWTKLPGMGVVNHEFSPDGGTLRLTMRRMPARNPLVHGADTNFLWQDERVPEDLRIAQAVFGDSLPASVCMANLVHKREHVDVKARVLKKRDWDRVVLGCVLIPDVVDSQGDQMSAEDIEKTAHDFLADARVVGKEHTDVWDGGEVVESYIAPVDMEFNDPAYGPQTVPKGSWVLGVRIPEASWGDVLDGSFTGFSVGGWGEREDVAA